MYFFQDIPIYSTILLDAARDIRLGKSWVEEVSVLFIGQQAPRDLALENKWP